MGVGTNENVKNINDNIQDFEKVENCVNECNTTENTKDVQQDNNFNSDNAQENVNQVEIIEPNFQLINNTQEQEQTQAINMQAFNMQETQRIEILSELLKDTENSKKELAVNLQAENLEQENSNIETNKHVQVIEKGEPVESVEQIESVEPVQAETKLEQQIIQNENPQETNTNEIKPNDPEDIDKKQKQHVQDKKDFRLERMLFDRINKMQGKIKESLELIKKFERINAKEENLPNIVTTLHDKLTQEVIKQFRTVGIEFNMKSYLVQSIVSDLLNKFEEGITEFKDCSENLNFVREVQEDFESRVELAPTSKVKNIFARLRGLFKPERKQERLEQLERERQEKKLEEANIHLIKYKFINSELERYTIRKNIVNSLTREILHGQGSGLTLNVTEFINEKIASEMKMLGLDGLLPELEEKLFEEYKEKFEGVQKEEFFSLSVGEVKKNIKFSRVGYLRSKVSVVTNSKVEEEERMVV